jgi:hypothetical protein
MHVYASDFWGFRIAIPEQWELASWKHMKIKRSWRRLFQQREDDIPDTPGQSKFLFTANRYSPESKAVVEASIEMSISRLGPDVDFYDSMLANLARESRKIHDEGSWIIGNEYFSYLDEVIERKDSTARFRFAWKSFMDGLWLYVKIAGYSDAWFAEAIAIFGAMKWNK